MRPFLWLALSPLVAACGNAAVGPTFDYPLDDTLRFHHVQVKGTHNSYHVETTGGQVKEWHFTQATLDVQLGEQGVRQLELDVNYDSQLGYFEVYHVPAADEGTVCRRFTDCLAQVKAFSDAAPWHMPIFVQIEPKTGFKPDHAEEFFAHLEAEILSVFPSERVVTPAFVQGAAASLPAAVAADGWPTLGRLRGKLLFSFDDVGAVRDAYTHGGKDLAGRLVFVDSAPGDPFGAVAVLNDPTTESAAIAAALGAGFLVRTRADADGAQAWANDTSQLQAALASGAHFISTDFPAPMADTTYVVQIPGGAPARCNPLTAPAACTAAAIEHPM